MERLTVKASITNYRCRLTCPFVLDARSLVDDAVLGLAHRLFFRTVWGRIFFTRSISWVA